MRVICLLAALAAASAVPQAPHRLERLPSAALLAEGRVVESAPGTLVLEEDEVLVGSEALLAVERTSFDLSEVRGFVYFVRQDRELELRQGLGELREGARREGGIAIGTPRRFP